MFSEDINTEILSAAKLTNEEICGYITTNDEVVFLENTSKKPTDNFVMDFPEDAKALFHSHPDGPFYPSEADMQQQVVTDIPWGIACTADVHNEIFWFGDSVPKPPLIGRGFRHGVTDCYGLIRDFYKEIHDIYLEEFPRDWEWWTGNQTLYMDGFKQAGFHEIPTSEIQPGDSFLASIRSATPNHAGVYIGDGLILHHTCGRTGYDPTRLSTVEPAARWMAFLTKVLRHENDNIDRSVGQKIWPQT